MTPLIWPVYDLDSGLSNDFGAKLLAESIGRR